MKLTSITDKKEFYFMPERLSHITISPHYPDSAYVYLHGVSYPIIVAKEEADSLINEVEGGVKFLRPEYIPPKSNSLGLKK